MAFEKHDFHDQAEHAGRNVDHLNVGLRYAPYHGQL